MTKDNEMVGDVYYPAPEVIEQAHIKDYDAVHQAALDDLPGFWGKNEFLDTLTRTHARVRARGNSGY